MIPNFAQFVADNDAPGQQNMNNILLIQLHGFSKYFEGNFVMRAT